MITTLVVCVLTAVTNIFQIYFDYKKAEVQGHSHIYRDYQSECCNIKINDDEKEGEIPKNK